MKIIRIFSSVLCISFLFMQDSLAKDRLSGTDANQSVLLPGDPNGILGGGINTNILASRNAAMLAATRADESLSSAKTIAKQNQEYVKVQQVQQKTQSNIGTSSRPEGIVTKSNVVLPPSTGTGNSNRDTVLKGNSFSTDHHVEHEKTASMNAIQKMQDLINANKSQEWYQKANTTETDFAKAFGKDNKDMAEKGHNDFISQITNISSDKKNNYLADPNAKPDMRVIKAAFDSLAGPEKEIDAIKKAKIDVDSIGKMKGLTKEEQAEIQHLFGKYDKENITIEKVFELYHTIEHDTVQTGLVHGVDVSIPQRQLELLSKVAAAHLYDQVVEEHNTSGMLTSADDNVFIHTGKFEEVLESEKAHLNEVNKLSEEQFSKLSPKESFLLTYQHAIEALPNDSAAYDNKNTATKAGVYQQSYDLMQAILNTKPMDYELVKMIRESTPDYVKHDATQSWGGASVSMSEKDLEKIKETNHQAMMLKQEVEVNGVKYTVAQVEAMLDHLNGVKDAVRPENMPANINKEELLQKYGEALKTYVDSKADGQSWHMAIKDEDVRMVMNDHEKVTTTYEHVARNNYKNVHSGEATSEII